MAEMKSSILQGIEARPVTVRSEPARGGASKVEGLSETACKETAVRVRSALERVEVPGVTRTTIAADDGDPIRRGGMALDLPAAITALEELGAGDVAELGRAMAIGELGLDGTVRPVRGALAAAELARRLGFEAIIVPEANAHEAELGAGGIAVRVVSHLGEIVDAMSGEHPLRPPQYAAPPLPRESSRLGDMADIVETPGTRAGRRALELAAAGGHSALLVGPPGIGKTMLARRAPTILPELTPGEALESSRIYSAIGMLPAPLRERPYRAPHHTISEAALTGGGAGAPRPGELSLAHNGVLFLDELQEFSRTAIAHISSAWWRGTVRPYGRVIELPSEFTLIASASPCPCGWHGSEGPHARPCTCDEGRLARYHALSLGGPVGFDLSVRLAPVSLQEMRRDLPRGEASDKIRARVTEARERQRKRAGRKWGASTNARLPIDALRPRVSREADRALRELAPSREAQALRVARTLADLRGSEWIRGVDVEEAQTLNDAGGGE